MWRRGVFGCLSLLVAISTASAEDFYIEGPSVATRTEAAAMGRSAAEAGHKAKVVRRFRDGTGWEFLFRVEGFESQAAALAAATQITEAVGRGVMVFGEEGDSLESVEAPAAPVQADPTSETKLSELLAGHGELAPWPTIQKLVFVRTVPSGPTVEHVWASRGKDLYLSVKILEGEGRNSVTRVVDTQAVLTVDGASEPQDPERARDTLKRFSPRATIPFVVDLAGLAEETDALSAKGEVEQAGETLKLYGSASGGVEIGVDTSQRLRRIRVGPTTSHRLDGYKQLGGLWVPTEIRTFEADELVDAVKVLEVGVDAELPDEWFAVP